MKLKILIPFALFFSASIQAQENTENLDSIFEIKPNYYEQPKVMPTPQKPINQELYLPSFVFPVEDPRTISKPLRHRESKKKIMPYSYLLSMGIGSYLSPRIEINYSSKNLKTGVHASHYQYFRGAKDGKHSASSQTNITLSKSHTRQHHQLYFEVLANAKTVHFYGYHVPSELVQPSEIQQKFKTLITKFSWLNAHQKNTLTYQTNVESWWWMDRFKSKEIGIRSRFSLHHQKTQTKRFEFNIHGQSLLASDSAQRWQHAYVIGGNYHLHQHRFRLKIGAKIGIDQFKEQYELVPMPELHLEYDMRPNQLILYGTIKGQIQTKSKRQLASENPFLQPHFQSRNVHEIISNRIGFRGVFRKKLNIEWHVFHGIYNHFYVFQNLDNKPRYFVLHTDHQAIHQYGLAANLSYVYGKIQSEWSVKWTKYQTSTLKKAWHLPELNASASLRYQYDKSHFAIGLDYADKIAIYNTEKQNATFLPAKINAWVKEKYQFNSKSSVYLKINNLINRNYYYFQHYKALGIELIVGTNLRF